MTEEIVDSFLSGVIVDIFVLLFGGEKKGLATAAL